MLFKNKNNRFSSIAQCALCSMLLGWASAAVAHDEVKIAVVDLDYLVINSVQGKALAAQLAQFQSQVQAEAEALNQQAQKTRQQLTEHTATMNDSQRNELQQQYDALTTQIAGFRTDKMNEGQKMQQAGLQQIEKQLEPIFEQFQNENGYDLILNNVSGVVVMASDKVDITEQMIQLLNNQ